MSGMMLPNPWFPLLPDTQSLHVTMATHTHTGGAQPKATVKPTAAIWAKPRPRRKPDIVDQAVNWIWVQMRWAGRHPGWWKELWALYWDHPVCNLCDICALEYSWWQAAASGYPWPKQKHVYGGRPLAAWMCYVTETSCPGMIPWHEGLPCHQARGNPSLGPSPSMAHEEIGDASQGPVWGCTGSPKVHAPLMWRLHCWAPSMTGP